MKANHDQQHQNEKIARGLFLHTRYMTAFNDPVAAIICSQIHYWYSPSKSGQSKLRVHKMGKFWIAKSGREWAEETGLTNAQVKRGLGVLVDRAVIEKMVTLFNGAPTVHVRALHVQSKVLLDGEYLLPIASGDKSNSQEPNPLAADAESVAFHSLPLDTHAKSVTETLHNINTETTQDSMASDDAGSPKQEKLKHQPPEESKDIDVVNLPKPITSMSPQDVWRQLTAQHAGEFGEYLPPGKKELGQLNQLSKMLGDRTEPVLILLFQKWIGFTKYAKAEHGAYSMPHLPKIDFILKNAQAALHYWRSLVEVIDGASADNSDTGIFQPAPNGSPATNSGVPASHVSPELPQPPNHAAACSGAGITDDDEKPITLEQILKLRAEREAKRIAALTLK